jgi:MoaA/NifB/PqqE/SkfB family radical SAM enzyme/NADP-dependent 3-hydroxy acid dehydrogenase YdfG
MFSLDSINEYQIELTTYCNAACPQCPRNINGGKVNPHLKLEHLDRHVIDRAFPADLCNRLQQVFFCGSYGDPIMHPDFLDILRDFRKKSPTLWLYMHTNGGAHSVDFWRDVAEIIGDYGQVDFNIDGLADTNHIYRRNTNFDKIITNAEAFIRAGGRAVWNYIIFEHNQHQLDEARLLSELIGFKEFKSRATGRFLNHKTMETFDSWPVEDRTGKRVFEIKPTTLDSQKNQSIEFLPQLKKQYPDMAEYFKTVDICCDSLEHKRVAINAHGMVLPCNMLNHNLQDARFFDPDVLPCSNSLSTVDGKNQVSEFINQHGADTLNIKNNSLEQVFKSSFWHSLTQSWTYQTYPERLFECAMTCGKQFTKVWDQTKMTKKYLITGGNRGLGLALVNHTKGTSISRADGFNITNKEDIKRIAQESLKYDVFINNAFDGPPQEEWANFGQVQLLLEVYRVWAENNKTGYIFNIGSSGEQTVVPPEPSFETYRVAKSALAHASKQATQAFKQNKVRFKTTLITPDRLDTELSRNRPTWTGNGIALKDLTDFIDYATNTQANTCIDELIIYCNLDYKDN